MKLTQDQCLRSRVRDHVAGAVEGDIETILFAVTDGFVGKLWPQVYECLEQAQDAATTLEGQVVLVSLRILEDAEGDSWPLPEKVTRL